jgi:hypothetical protein
MKILEKQSCHLVFLVVLLLGVSAAARGEALVGSLWGIPTRTWLWLSILLPVIHQIYVVICWRAELYYQTLSKTFGDQAFFLWGAGFLVLFLARSVVIIGLAFANQGTQPFPVWLAWTLSAVFLALVIYLVYSVLRFFGIKRALGQDHFQPQMYQNLPMVQSGIFKWSSNPMYLFGFLALWIPGLLLFSRAALLAALFNHLYIWVHFYFTELPDIRYIYGAD